MSSDSVWGGTTSEAAPQTTQATLRLASGSIFLPALRAGETSRKGVSKT